jgi:hypothetical protein
MNRGKFVFLCAVMAVSIMALFSTPAGKTADKDEKGIWRHHERQAPTKEILSIFALPDGRIIAGTAASLHTYDGVRWKKQVFESSLLSRHAPLYADTGGRLYFIENNHLAILSGGVITRYDSQELSEPICLAKGADGTLYIGSYHLNTSGLYAFDGKDFTKLYDGRVRSLAVEQSGKIWVTALPPGGSAQKLMVKDDGGWTDRTDEINGILPVVENNLMVQADPDGAVWVTNEGSYGIWRNGAWTLRKNPGGGNPVALAFDRNGRTWGYSYRTLYLLDGTGAWKVSRTCESTLPNNGFLAVASDSTVYTFDGVQLYRLNGSSWEAIKNPFDLGSDMVTCLAFLDDGRLICGHGVRGLTYTSQVHGGLSVYDGKTWTNFTVGKDDVPVEDVFILEQAPFGDVFIYSNGGYYFYDGNSFDSLDSLLFFDVTDVEWDSDEMMWLTTNKGLVQFRNPEFSLSEPPYMYNRWGGVYNLSCDDNEKIYMMSVAPDGKGPIIYTDLAKWYLLIQNSGGSVLDVAVQPDGTVWGSRLSDLARWDTIDQAWIPVVVFPDSNRFVHIDDSGRIWASSYGKTGYLQDGTFYTIPELSGIAASTVALSEAGQIAVNAFNREHTEYYGVYEYNPQQVSVGEPNRPSHFLTAAVYPNPFNPAVTIQFELPVPGRVKIDIYNIAGQRIKMVADRSFSAGVNRVVWDSHTDSGPVASSGVYFYRIEAGKRVMTGKMLLMR